MQAEDCSGKLSTPTWRSSGSVTVSVTGKDDCPATLILAKSGETVFPVTPARGCLSSMTGEESAWAGSASA